ncbi:F-box/LRR-repeat protein At5g02910-like [Oryza brachyantha]|uniref:F-box/LRR-repeat protein At5g02910-like n=1 Tax=Oryza brachyantha TaxID=4533 RepID=UPI000776793D|nr:F-box/LRR-repeat protein At5g02910-like [Oryza brachyantha]
MDGAANGEDLISTLPDDVLHEFLLRLPSADAAAQTSLLSRRWRYVWAHMPEVQFSYPVDLHRVRLALTAYAAPVLRRLHIITCDANPEAMTTILRLAAPRLSGSLFFHNEESLDPDEEEDEEEWRVYYDDEEGMDGAIAREIASADGLTNLAIHSKSLLQIVLGDVAMQQLIVEAPMLTVLDVRRCFVGQQPKANIFAPLLEILYWIDLYNPATVQLTMKKDLRKLRTYSIMVYGGAPLDKHNLDSARLLKFFEAITTLDLFLQYPSDMIDMQYLMGMITKLPKTENLSLELSTEGHRPHDFGPCVFYLLTMATGIRSLSMKLVIDNDERTVCSWDCICHQPQGWETEHISLDSLEEVEIFGLLRAKHEFVFVKRLLGWAANLKKITLNFAPSVVVTDEERQKLLGLASRPETCIKINFSKGYGGGVHQ